MIVALNRLLNWITDWIMWPWIGESPWPGLLVVSLFTAAICVVVLAVALWHSPERHLNVLLITLDTTRADRLGCYGYAAANTSALDALARRGVLFERAYVPAPLTLPSHTTMLTGLYPPEHGVRANGEGSLPEFIPTLASRLHEEGYSTAAFVAAFVLDRKFGLARGFEVYQPVEKGVSPSPAIAITEEVTLSQRD